MAITVNSNISSLNAQRHLQRSTVQLNKSLERLSSGLRINRAGDDAAGLAISEGLRSQIRGINQAIRNANDGLSMIATGESSIGAYTDLLQRMRELAVQSANDTNSPANRAALQEEADQLLEEMSRIANTVEFNGTKLLDGSFTSKQLQVGANVGQTIDVTMGDLRTTQIGAVAHTTTTASTAALSIGDLVINGVDVGASLPDNLSFANQNASAIAIAAAINDDSAATNVRATVEDTTVTGDLATGIQGIDINGTTRTLVINGVNLGAVVVSADDADGALRDKINEISNVTGVTATKDASDQLVLTAADGRNITITTTGDVANLGVGEALGLTADTGAGVADNVAAVTTGGTIRLSSDTGFSVGGAAPGNAGLTNTPVAVDFATAVNTISLTTQSGANSTIEAVDNALRQVNSIRGDLGAITNRLEITIQSLQAVSENLSASDSRIRDADFAAETANLTKNQILQQAGVSVLAQANATTQAAVQLLQG